MDVMDTAIREIELLAPGGDVDSIKAAIAAGADAVYCGLDRFNARNSAENISFDDLQGILRLAHSNNCQVFLTLNIIIVESELPSLLTLLNRLANTSIDGIIVQDPGVIYLLSNCFKGLKIHASTQLTTHNDGQIKFLSRLGVIRVNLSRELNIHEIKSLTETAHRHNMLTEVFVHGSNCICFSGICYLSSLHGGTSGNRGRCSQPCRDQYITTKTGKDFPLNLKDNSAFHNLKELAGAGVDSLKIEGRIKKFHYVYTVVKAWREELHKLYNGDTLSSDKSVLYCVFNRDFSNAFLTGVISKTMFIDNPRDHSAIHLAGGSSGSETDLEHAKKEIYDERTGLIGDVKNIIDKLSISKAPLTMTVSGEPGSPLSISIKTPDTSFAVQSETDLTDRGKQALDSETLLKSFKAINDTEYFIAHPELITLQPGLYLPFKELTSLKKRILFQLNGSRVAADPVDPPVLKKSTTVAAKPELSILISSRDDLQLCSVTSAYIYYQMPSVMKEIYTGLIDLFRENKRLIPWFPSILIGADYSAAVEFLKEMKPEIIVTDNSGIANEAYETGIPWIAGPHLNIVNSFSLLCLKEHLSCTGAFISNEINEQQIRSIKKPENFNLYYSIYHPIELMTSRQCLFHQIDGCVKDAIDNNCIGDCERTAAITSLKNVTLRIEKSKGNYHSIYNDTNYLNTDILKALPGLFTGFLIDLRDIKTGTTLEIDKPAIIKLFEEYLEGSDDSAQQLHLAIHPTTCIQYIKGI